jgi:HK97 family phage portal protein
MLRWLRKFGSRIVAQYFSTRSTATWFLDWLRNDVESDSGVTIDGKRALQYAPVWYAVNRIAGHVAQLPLVIHVRTGERSKRRATEHPAYRLLKKRPNSLMNASVFKELLQYHALLWGNGRAVIMRDGRGDAVELLPLLPAETFTVLVDGWKWHVTTVDGRQYRFRDENVLHIAGLGYDGLQGYPLWQLAKNSWGLGLASEKHANRTFRQRAVPGMILEAPPGVFPDDEEARKFLQAFRDMHEGLDNEGRTALLREGIKATRLAQTGAEAQMVEQRKFQRGEVALWFLLESILGDDASVSYKSLEQKHMAYLVNCLNRWLVKWEEECEEKLFREREKLADTHFCKFITAALLRSDTKTTYETLSLGIRACIITSNEARDILDLNAVEDDPEADKLRNPAVTIGAAAASQPDSGEDEDEDDEDTAAERTRQRLRAVIVARVSDLARVELQRLHTIDESPDAATRQEAFFASWQPKLLEALRPLAVEGAALDAAIAAWIRDSREAPERHEAVWMSRAAALADQLLDDGQQPASDPNHQAA